MNEASILSQHQRNDSFGSSESGHRKRNSTCLQSNAQQQQQQTGFSHAGELSRYPSGSFRKTRRFTVENASVAPGVSLYDVNNQPTEQTAADNLRQGQRRSSLYTPKPAWPGAELWDNVNNGSGSAFNPLQNFSDQYDSENGPFQVSFDIPKLHSVNRGSMSYGGESKSDTYYYYDPRYSSSAMDHDSSSFSNDHMKKGAWTREEDDLLIKYGGMATNKNWTEIAEKIPGRSAKQCRERWCFNLDPSIKKELWTPDEDIMLIRKQMEVGNKWAQIAMLLPGRTENAVKTRFKSILRARKREWKPTEDQLLLQLHQSMGANWEGISSRMASHRTKHAVKMRFKELVTGLDTLKFPEFGSARQTVREAYYPEASMKQISEHYKRLASGTTATPMSNPVGALEQMPMATIPRMNSQPNFMRYDSRGGFPSFYMSSGIKQEQGNPAALVNNSIDPFDDFFNLCAEDDPLAIA